MYFTEFKIKNFKGIENIVLPLSSLRKGQIHTLVGLNESGKTTVLEAINAFSDRNSNYEEVLYEGTHKGSSITDYVPKHKKSNFTGVISIQAAIALEKVDIKDLSEYLLKTHDFILNEKKLGEQFSINKVFYFEDSNLKSSKNLWDIRLVGRKKRAKSEKILSASDDLWQKTIGFIGKRIPAISYFPTFLFDFPEKIYLEESEHETKLNKYYRTVIQDILDSLGEGLDVQKHIVDRVQEKNSEGALIFNPFLYFNSKNTKSQIDSVLLKIGDKVTEVIFKTWNEVFERKLENKNVTVSFGVENQADESTQKVYLEFYIKDGSSSYSITERSLGFRWFFCFLLFTQFRGFRKNSKNALFLFDEPASNLHSGAQNLLLDSFPKVTDKGCSIIYSTHSHHLINPKWLENTFIVQNLAIDYDEEGKDGAPPHTNIKLDRYRSFVGQFPDKLTYFQPILEKLEYRPSPLEHIPDVVIFEGKHDYYAFSYFDKFIIKSKTPLNYMPGTGAGDLGCLISLYKGWGRKFIVLLDADKDGVVAKENYLQEWLLLPEQVFLLSDINPHWEGYTLEKLFSDTDRQRICEQQNVVNPKKGKKAIARFMQEKTLSAEMIDFDSETVKNFNMVISFLREKMSLLQKEK